MANKVFEVVEVPGSKRSSPRPYSHAIIGCWNGVIAANRAEAEWKLNGKKWLANDRKDWIYREADSKRKVGDVRKNHNGYMMEVRDYEIEISSGFIAENPDLEAYIAKKEAEYKAYIDKLRAEPKGPLSVLRWSMSYANAMAGVSAFPNYCDVRIVPVVEKVKPAKKAKSEAN